MKASKKSIKDSQRPENLLGENIVNVIQVCLAKAHNLLIAACYVDQKAGDLESDIYRFLVLEALKEVNAAKNWFINITIYDSDVEADIEQAIEIMMTAVNDLAVQNERTFSGLDDEKLVDILNEKDIRSCWTMRPVTFVKDLYSLPLDDESGVFSDGIDIVDTYARSSDDISKMYCNLEHGGTMNMEDFYSEFGAYDRDSSFLCDLRTRIRDRH